MWTREDRIRSKMHRWVFSSLPCPALLIPSLLGSVLFCLFLSSLLLSSPLLSSPLLSSPLSSLFLLPSRLCHSILLLCFVLQIYYLFLFICLFVYSSLVFLIVVRKPYPVLTGPPQVMPVIPTDPVTAGSSVDLGCTYNVEDAGSFDVGYEVTWYKAMRFFGGNRGKLVLLSRRTTESPFIVSLGTSDFHLGDSVS